MLSLKSAVFFGAPEGIIAKDVYAAAEAAVLFECIRGFGLGIATAVANQSEAKARSRTGLECRGVNR